MATAIAQASVAFQLAVKALIVGAMVFALDQIALKPHAAAPTARMEAVWALIVQILELNRVEEVVRCVLFFDIVLFYPDRLSCYIYANLKSSSQPPGNVVTPSPCITTTFTACNTLCEIDSTSSSCDTRCSGTSQIPAQTS